MSLTILTVNLASQLLDRTGLATMNDQDTCIVQTKYEMRKAALSKLLRVSCYHAFMQCEKTAMSNCMLLAAIKLTVSLFPGNVKSDFPSFMHLQAWVHTNWGAVEL